MYISLSLSPTPSPSLSDYPIECACGHSTSCLLVNPPRVMVRKGGRKKPPKEPLGDPEIPEEEPFHRSVV